MRNMNVVPDLHMVKTTSPWGFLGSYVESVKQNFNHLEHGLLDNNQIEGFLKGNFDGEGKLLIKKLKPFGVQSRPSETMRLGSHWRMVYRYWLQGHNPDRRSS